MRGGVRGQGREGGGERKWGREREKSAQGTGGGRGGVERRLRGEEGGRHRGEGERGGGRGRFRERARGESTQRRDEGSRRREAEGL